MAAITVHIAKAAYMLGCKTASGENCAELAEKYANQMAELNNLD